MPRSISLSGGSSVNFIGQRRDLLRRSRDVIKAVSEGWLDLRIHRVFPLEQAAEAHQLLENRNTIGKVLLRVGDRE